MARALPACPAPALLCTGQAGDGGLQTLHAGVGVVTQLTAEAAVNHQPHPIDRQGAFGNGARQDDAAVLVGIAALQG